jgi:hypothetical protein
VLLFLLFNFNELFYFTSHATDRATTMMMMVVVVMMVVMIRVFKKIKYPHVEWFLG